MNGGVYKLHCLSAEKILYIVIVSGSHPQSCLLVLIPAENRNRMMYGRILDLSMFAQLSSSTSQCATFNPSVPGPMRMREA